MDTKGRPQSSNIETGASFDLGKVLSYLYDMNPKLPTYPAGTKLSPYSSGFSLDTAYSPPSAASFGQGWGSSPASSATNGNGKYNFAGASPMGIYVGTPNEYNGGKALSSLLPGSVSPFDSWAARAAASNAPGMPGPQSFPVTDFFNSLSPMPTLNGNLFTATSAPNAPNAPNGYINNNKPVAERLPSSPAGIALATPAQWGKSFPSPVPNTAVAGRDVSGVPSYDQMASAFTDARQPLKLNVAGGHPQSWGYGVGVPDTPAAKATAQMAAAPTALPRAVNIGPYTYVPDNGKLVRIGRVDPGKGDNILDGMIGGMIKQSGFDYGGPMSGPDMAMAQGFAPPIPKPPVNRTGVTPDGTEWANGVKTGRVNSPFAEMSTQNRQTATTAMMAEMARLQSANPVAAGINSRLQALFADPNNNGTTRDELQQNAQLKSIGWNDMSQAQRAAWTVDDGERQRLAQLGRAGR